jgi:ATP-binding cassette subfamily C protein LapB
MTESLVPAPPERFASWLVEPMRRNKATYIKVALAAAMINIFGLVTSLFTMTVYDRVLPNNATDSLIALSIGLAIVIVFDFMLRTLRAYFVDIAGAQVDREIGEDLFERILRIRLELKKGSTGALAGLLREFETMRDFFASATLTAVVDVPFILLTLAVIAMIGGKVALVPIVMVPLVILVGWLTQPALDRLSARSLSEGFIKQSVLIETIGAIETVKAAGAGPLLSGRWSEAIEQHSDSSLRQRLVAAIGINTAAAASTISYAGVVIVGAGMIAENELTMGALIACSILSGRAVAPLAQISQLLSRISATKTAYRQLSALMAMPVEGPSGEALRPSSITGKVEFRSVSFRYPGASEKALNEISFTINAGEHLALLGPVGSGKSTIARLVLGLYPADDGLVLIDGTDVRHFDPDELRRSMGAALQESVLFSGSVRENIALADGAIDDPELIRVAQVSGTHQFMGQIANGYDLRLADRGEGLSGGQRQSIAIARALAGRPPILVFDEPTSAMDTQTEDALIQRLQVEAADKTMIVITHRPSMLKLVKRIVIVKPDGSSPTAPATRSSSASRDRRRPEMADMETTAESPHLEDLADRIRPRAASNLLLWAILGFVGIFLIWAALTELDRTVRGQGRIIASSQLQVVSNLEGGIVDEILVRVGQQVRQGQAIIRLNRTQPGAEFGSGQATVAALRAKIARLEAEVAGRSPNYPSSTDAAMATQVAIERSLYAARMANLSAINSAAQARVVQSQRAANEATAAYEARLSASDAARTELGAIRPLVERGIEPQLSLVRAESAAAVAAAEASAASAAAARAQSGIAEARSVLTQQQQEWRSQAAEELAAARAELAARQRALPALADRVQRTEVRAPLAGRINRVLVTTVGGSVGPGAPLVEIVPARETLLVEAMVLPKDIGSVSIGQRAKVDISAYDPAVYGSLSGRVSAISPDAVEDERTGQTFYIVQVQTDSDRTGTGRKLAIGAGMTADVSLLGDKRSVLSYLLSPITRLSERAFRE